MLDEAAIRAAIELIPAPVTALAPDGLSVAANAPYLDLFGISEDELVGRPLESVVHPDDLMAAQQIINSSVPDRPAGPLDIRVSDRTGHWVRCSWLLRADEATGWLLALAIDVTEDRARAHRLEQEATRDALTGAANRKALMDLLDQLPGSSDLAIAVVDLDRFKAVNDTFGHATGDAVLRAMATRLRIAVPEALLVCRTGGDEFALVLGHGSPSPDTIGERLIDALTKPIAINTRLISVSGSVGLAVGARGLPPAELLQHADFAVYEAKQTSSSANWVVADAALVDRRRSEALLEQQMRGALGTGQFQPYFQPIARVSDGSIVAHESLVRWQRKDGTLVPAGVFIELAADVGLVGTIGREVVTQSLEVAANASSHLGISINLSPAELIDREWLISVVDLIDDLGLDRRRVTFEITETSLIQDLKLAKQRLRRLSDEQFWISLDDFGSGYSSLNYLTQLPIDEVKLDRALLARGRESATAMRTFEATIEFVRKLGRRMVVEGVETQEDHDVLLSLGVDLAQGWYYGRPVPAQEVLHAERLGLLEL